MTNQEFGEVVQKVLEVPLRLDVLQRVTLVWYHSDTEKLELWTSLKPDASTDRLTFKEITPPALVPILRLLHCLTGQPFQFVVGSHKSIVFFRKDVEDKIRQMEIAKHETQSLGDSGTIIGG